MWKPFVVAAGVVAALVSLPLLSTESRSEQIAAGPQHRVVMHLNSGDEKVQRGALGNIRNLYHELGRERLQVELVVHGAGLSLLTKKTLFGAELTTLKAEFGVQYTACSNTMKSQQLTRADLVDEVGDTVPAVVRLMERQEQGWAYIKP